MNDNTPELVRLPAGSYKIFAEAETGGGTTVTAWVRVVVAAGQTTVVHLEPDWQPARGVKSDSAGVRAADGRTVGRRAQPDEQREPR